jgi:hypothetical protein
MPPRGRKYSAAAPDAVLDAQEEQRAAENQTQVQARRDQAKWRYDLIVRAGSSMTASGDPAWLAVADWLRQAVISANASRMNRGDPVLPAGQFDWAGKISSAYLKTRGDAPKEGGQ